MARRIWKRLPGGKFKEWKASNHTNRRSTKKSGTGWWYRNLQRRRRRRIYRDDHYADLEVKDLLRFIW